MIILSIVLGILLGLARGGKLSNINKLKVNYFLVLIIAVIANVILLFISTKFNNSISKLIFDNFGYINIITFIIIIAVLSANREIKYSSLILSGFILNFLPIFFSKGKMPVSAKAIIKAKDLDSLILLNEGRIATHTIMTNETKFKIFADTIAIKTFHFVISAGDILIGIGLILLISHLMVGERT
ncbi:MAG: DUF5317 family protein [Tissierellia bacterium]|nr:DUF5317 family protein [Tissierellia bacterium]